MYIEGPVLITILINKCINAFKFCSTTLELNQYNTNWAWPIPLVIFLQSVRLYSNAEKEITPENLQRV